MVALLIALLIVACLAARYATVATHLNTGICYAILQATKRERDRHESAKQEDGEQGAGNLGAGEYGRQSCAWHRGP